MGYYYHQDYYIQSRGQIPYYTSLCNSIPALLLLSSLFSSSEFQLSKYLSIESLKGLRVLFALISLVEYTQAIESRSVILQESSTLEYRVGWTGSKLSSRVSKELRVYDITTKYNTSIKFGLDKGSKPLYNRELAAVSSILSSI